MNFQEEKKNILNQRRKVKLKNGKKLTRLFNKKYDLPYQPGPKEHTRFLRQRKTTDIKI